MTLLTDVLQASGGLDRWRRLRRYTLHLSIGGALCARRYTAARLKDLVVDGAVHEQRLEIVGFNASDRRAVYGADGVTLEGADGRRLGARRAPPAEFRSQLGAPTWDELQLAHFCGYLLWNYVHVPFVLADPDFEAEELDPVTAHGETWRRLRADFPARVITHAAEQVFSFDHDGRLRRLEYSAHFANHAPAIQLFSGHQRFSGISLPTLCRILSNTPGGVTDTRSSLIDIEIFDALFE
jgi:hypothetical protein